MGFVIGIINGSIAALGEAISLAMAILPDSPLVMTETLDLKYLGYINYFVPIGKMVVLGSSWLLCITLWYIAQIALRWAKAIQ